MERFLKLVALAKIPFSMESRWFLLLAVLRVANTAPMRSLGLAGLVAKELQNSMAEMVGPLIISREVEAVAQVGLMVLEKMVVVPTEQAHLNLAAAVVALAAVAARLVKILKTFRLAQLVERHKMERRAAQALRYQQILATPGRTGQVEAQGVALPVAQAETVSNGTRRMVQAEAAVAVVVQAVLADYMAVAVAVDFGPVALAAMVPKE